MKFSDNQGMESLVSCMHACCFQGANLSLEILYISMEIVYFLEHSLKSSRNPLGLLEFTYSFMK